MNAEQHEPLDGAEESTDTYDIVLRYLTARFAEQLVRPFLEDPEMAEVKGMPDTQLAARERRLDRNVRVERGDGSDEVVHIEFQLELRGDLGGRMFDYHAMLAAALRPHGSGEMPRIRSVAVVLQGPVTNPPTEGFATTGGMRLEYLIDPVYAMTLADLKARDAPMWMVFAPLTVDASEATLKRVLEELDRSGLSVSQLADLKAAMTVMGRADKRKRGLEAVLGRLIEAEEIMSSDILEGTLLGKALKLKLKREFQEKEAQNLAQVARHKLKRELTELEYQTLHQHIDQLGAEAALDHILNATPDTLSAWLDVPA